jgi:hypothetical protein
MEDKVVFFIDCCGLAAGSFDSSSAALVVAGAFASGSAMSSLVAWIIFPS